MYNKINLYAYSKDLVDEQGVPLFKNKTEYKYFIHRFLPFLGLNNEYIKSKKIVKPLIKDEWGFVTQKEKCFQYNKYTGICTCLHQNYIYITIQDERKLSWNTVIRKLHIKKNHRCFFVEKHFIEEYKTKNFIQNKYLAIPVNLILNIEYIQEQFDKIFHKNVKIVDKLKYIFSFDCVIRDIYTNKILKFYEIIDIVNNHKKLNIIHYIYKWKDDSNPIIYRVHNKKENQDKWLYKTKKEILIENNIENCSEEKFKILNIIRQTEFEYKESWKINEQNEVKNKLYIIIPNLLRQNSFRCLNINECFNKVLYVITYFFRTKNEITINRNDFLEAFVYCYYNQKDLSLKFDKHISNIDKLNNNEKLLCSLLLNKVFNDTNIYKKENSIKQYKLFLQQFILEVFGKIKYELNTHNKTYDKDKYEKYSYFLDKHIKGIYISEKEYSLIIDSLKDKYKDFNLNPPIWLRYNILKSIGLNIDNNYYIGLYGKKINFFYDNIIQFLYNLFSLYNKDNKFIIIICLKKFLENFLKNKNCDINIIKNEKIFIKPPPN